MATWLQSIDWWRLPGLLAVTVYVNKLSRPNQKNKINIPQHHAQGTSVPWLSVADRFLSDSILVSCRAYLLWKILLSLWSFSTLLPAGCNWFVRLSSRPSVCKQVCFWSHTAVYCALVVFERRSRLRSTSSRLLCHCPPHRTDPGTISSQGNCPCGRSHHSRTSVTAAILRLCSTQLLSYKGRLRTCHKGADEFLVKCHMTPRKGLAERPFQGLSSAPI